MRDPFPISPIPALSKAIQPWADYLNLPTLPLHIHEVLLIAAFYQSIMMAAPILSTAVFSTRYTSLSRSKRLNWNVHVVSFVQSSMINCLALWVMFTDEERWNMDVQERVYGYSGAAGMIQALAAGYFLWDFLMTITHMNIFGLGMLAHAISALCVYSLGFRPFVNYYSTTFILWELSSPFLNIHWFFDKLGMTGSKGQLYNGIMLIVTFFSCRLVWGTYSSYRVASDVWAALNNTPSLIPTSADVVQKISVPVRYETTMQFASESSSIPLWLAAVYIAANLTLNSLNFYWFIKMIDAVRKRFDSKRQKESEKEKADQDGATATGVDGPAETKGRPRRRTILDGEGQDDEPPPGI
ncbi:DUF887 domain-containing protein [Pseudomassariella vexata]|uniref:DUF887 domain-containing protein n=1 Tax=Pseudomassariella vexata TaxID=1141098 RepID=A0A1Y2DBN5_9PEZI|nr:DUF887 domain-containing protein [Pseudomassariella vexata]ORY56672.1 DUF887 domain-containing protein [Pseudomassariella vexata]